MLALIFIQNNILYKARSLILLICFLEDFLKISLLKLYLNNYLIMQYFSNNIRIFYDDVNDNFFK